jgi:flagellar biosynthesis/type III secretory pathway protein FliH
LYELARHNEASALRHARTEGEAKGRAEGRAEGREEGRTEEREKWRNAVADKDAEIARLREQLESRG